MFVTETAGNATLYGAELELQWQPTGSDLFGANIQYLQTNYDEFDYQFYSVTGAPPVSAARSRRPRRSARRPRRASSTSTVRDGRWSTLRNGR